MITHITIADMARLRACERSWPLWHWLCGRAGSWTGEWTVELALELARLDGACTRVGALGWLECAGLVHHVLREADLSGADLSDDSLIGVKLDLC